MSKIAVGFPVASLAFAFALTLAPADVVGQTRPLRGQVVRLDGTPVPDADIRIVGAGDPLVSQSGEFEQAIPVGQESVEITIGDEGLEVLYPPAGRVPVPAGDIHVVIVVGEPAVKTVTKALAERTRQLQSVLSDNAQAFGDLEEAVRQIIGEIGVREEDLRDELLLKEQQAEHYPAIAETVRNYVLQARDLHSALSIVGSSSDNAQILRLTIEEALLPYNDAYTALNNRSDGFARVIEQYWESGDDRATEFRHFWNNTANELHQLEVLPMNEQLATIQTEVMDGNVNSSRARQARSDLLNRVAALEVRLDRLEAESNRLLQGLSPTCLNCSR